MKLIEKTKHERPTLFGQESSYYYDFVEFAHYEFPINLSNNHRLVTVEILSIIKAYQGEDLVFFYITDPPVNMKNNVSTRYRHKAMLTVETFIQVYGNYEIVEKWSYYSETLLFDIEEVDKWK